VRICDIAWTRDCIRAELMATIEGTGFVHDSTAEGLGAVRSGVGFKYRDHETSLPIGVAERVVETASRAS